MVKSGQVWAGLITCTDHTGALLTPTVGPVGALYVNGVANAAAVTITGANPYKWSVTLPALTAGDCVEMYLTATIGGIATASVVATDVSDTKRISDLQDIAAGAAMTLTGAYDAAKTAAAAGAQMDLVNAPNGTAVTAIQSGLATSANVATRAAPGDAMALTAGERTTLYAGIWAYATRTLTSLSALVSSIAAAVWTYVTRTLTSTAAATTAAVTGSALTIVKGRTYDATITGLTIPATWTAVKLTVKDDPADADSLSRLQLVVSNPAAAATDGVLYVERAAASVAQRLYGSLVVNQAAGTVAFHFYDDLTAVMERISGIKWDLTVYSPDGAETESLQLTRGAWDVELTETAALA